MYKHKQNTIILGFFLLITLTFLYTALPIDTYAESIENNKENHQLYQLKEDVELTNGITILAKTYLYGSRVGNDVQIQFADTYKEIPYSILSEVQLTNMPMYHESKGLENVVISSNTTLYDYKDAPSIQISSEIEFPIYINESGKKFIYIGNQQFYLVDESTDREAVNNNPEEVVKENLAEETLEIENETTSNENIEVDSSEPSSEITDGYEDDNKVIEENNSLNEEQIEEEKNATIEDIKPSVNKSEESADTDKMEKKEIAEVESHGSEKEINSIELEKKESKEKELEENSVQEISELTQKENIQMMPKSFSNSSAFKTDPWAGVSSKYFRVSTDNLIVYDNRGDGPLKPVGKLRKGQVYPIVSNYGNWHRIQFGNIYGYVRKSGTVPDNGKSLKSENKVFKNQSRTFRPLKDAMVYDNSSGSLIPFGTINKGQSYPISTDYGNWWRILFADRVGYLRKSEVKTEFKTGDKYFRVYQDNLQVYDNRGSGPLKKVGELEKGKAYSIVKDYGKNWWRVQFGDIYGYVRKANTGYATVSEINNLNKSYSNSGRKFITKKQVVVYDNTSGRLVPIGKIDKDLIYPIATDYGNWWRIIYLDQIGYVKKDYVDLYGIIETTYNLTLSEALNMQMKASPQTDSHYAYVSKTYIKNNKVTASSLNVRSGPGTGYEVVGNLSNGTKVTIVGEQNGWYQIKYNHGQWVNASSDDVLYYLDPTNFVDHSRQKFQFLDLSKASDATVTELNRYLSGKGTLSGQGKAFKDASEIHGINDVYLISHAILETGHGTSTLAKGVMYKGVKVYNMYGVGAYDNCPIDCGAKKAYEEGWTTPYKAIVGGAKFIGNSYIKAGQNTLYKMRWNPEGMATYGYATHQYATDIGWAYKQVGTMYNLYQALKLNNLYLDIPVYST